MMQAIAPELIAVKNFRSWSQREAHKFGQNGLSFMPCIKTKKYQSEMILLPFFRWFGC